MMMTVGELVAMLHRSLADRRVVLRGYEGGCDDVAAPQEVRILPNAPR